MKRLYKISAIIISIMSIALFLLTISAVFMVGFAGHRASPENEINGTLLYFFILPVILLKAYSTKRKHVFYPILAAMLEATGIIYILYVLVNEDAEGFVLFVILLFLILLCTSMFGLLLTIKDSFSNN